jgi:MFS family permease
LLCFFSEYWFPESPEHLTSLAVSEDAGNSNINKPRVQMLKLAKSFERLHGLSRQSSIQRAKNSVDGRLKETEALKLIEIEREASGEGGGFFKLYGYSLILALGITSGFALSAVNCLSAFAGTIFELAGTDPGSGNLAYASVQFAVAVLGIFWFYELYGRRTLLLMSAAGCTSGHLIIFIAFMLKVHVLAVVGMMVFIGSISVGLGSLSWVYASEILPNAVRPLGMTLAGISFWGLSFILNDQFPEMLDLFSTPGCFLVFAGLSAGVFIFIWTCLIETRGRSLEEIETLVMKK